MDIVTINPYIRRNLNFTMRFNMANTRIRSMRLPHLLGWFTLSLPLSVQAGEVLSVAAGNPATLDSGYWLILLASVCGGFVSMFISTEVDHRLYGTAHFAKLIIGSFLGVFACITWQAYVPAMTFIKLALPAFSLGALGAPIMVFALSYASDPKTFKKASDKVDGIAGFGQDKDN